VLHVQFQARNPSCQFRMRLWNFDVTYLYYLPWSFGNVYCVFNYGWKIQISRCWLPPVADLPLQKIQNKNCTQNRKNPRNCYYIFSPVGLVIFVISSVDLGYKKTGCRRRNVLKEDLVAEDLNPGVGELFWARLPGYGQKKPEVPMGAWVSNGLDYYGNLV